MTFRTLLLLLGTATIASAADAQLARPTNWRVRVDGSSTDTVYHVQMPPGWHITTGPGSLLYEPSEHAQGRFGVSLEVHLFPGTSAEGYGIFLGGSNLDSGEPSYVQFVSRRDGAAMIERVQGGQRTTLMPWKSGAVKPHPGTDDTVLNTVEVTVEGDSVRFEANGQRIGALPRAGLPLDGFYGIRAGTGLNLHVTNFDLTRRLAPARVRR